MIKIFNGKIIAPDGIEDKKVVLIKDTKIWDICSLDKMPQGKFQDIDADGGYIIPGLVDIHSDALEFKFSPRPNVNIQTSMALSYYEKELLSCGITTQFHGIYWGDVLEKHRSLKIAKEMIKKILDYRKNGVLNHKIFVRFDIANCEAKDELLHLINNENVDLISFQYHLPGQAQFKDIQAFKNYYVKVRGWSEQELNEFMENTFTFNINDKNKFAVLKEISHAAGKLKISLVSHDDDKLKKIQVMKKLGIKISEFPISQKAAGYAKKNGMYTAVGAPNIIQGKSSCGNVSAIDLIKKKKADIICSDYHLPSMLCAAVLLYNQGILNLPEAVNMITYNPAKATGLKNRGAFLPGNYADVVIFKLKDKIPEISKVFVNGRNVYSYGK